MLSVDVICEVWTIPYTNKRNEFWKLTISRLKKQIEQDEQDLKQIISELQKSQLVYRYYSFDWHPRVRFCAEEFIKNNYEHENIPLEPVIGQIWQIWPIYSCPKCDQIYGYGYLKKASTLGQEGNANKKFPRKNPNKTQT